MNERLPPPGYYEGFDGYSGAWVQKDPDYFQIQAQPMQAIVQGCVFDQTGLTITADGGITIHALEGDGYSGKNTKQMNIKMTEEDAKDIAEINQLFFEGEAPNSMLGRILLRKGIQFYKKMKANL